LPSLSLCCLCPPCCLNPSVRFYSDLQVDVLIIKNVLSQTLINTGLTWSIPRGAGTHFFYLILCILSSSSTCPALPQIPDQTPRPGRLCTMTMLTASVTQQFLGQVFEYKKKNIFLIIPTDNKKITVCPTLENHWACCSLV
jgi:hypothetical protein